MIFLILSWHLIVVGILAIIFSSMAGLFAWSIYVAGSLVIGLIMSVALRRTCPNLRSDTLDKVAVDRPLDYY